MGATAGTLTLRVTAFAKFASGRRGRSWCSWRVAALHHRRRGRLTSFSFPPFHHFPPIFNQRFFLISNSNTTGSFNQTCSSMHELHPIDWYFGEIHNTHHEFERTNRARGRPLITEWQRPFSSSVNPVTVVISPFQAARKISKRTFLTSTI